MLLKHKLSFWNTDSNMSRRSKESVLISTETLVKFVEIGNSLSNRATLRALISSTDGSGHILNSKFFSFSVSLFHSSADKKMPEEETEY